MGLQLGLDILIDAWESGEECGPPTAIMNIDALYSLDNSLLSLTGQQIAQMVLSRMQVQCVVCTCVCVLYLLLCRI